MQIHTLILIKIIIWNKIKIIIVNLYKLIRIFYKPRYISLDVIEITVFFDRNQFKNK